MWPLRAARTRLDDRWARLGVVGRIHRPAFGSIVSPPDRLGWRHGAGAVHCSDGGIPLLGIAVTRLSGLDAAEGRRGAPQGQVF